MPWLQRLNDDEGHIVPDGSNDVRRLMTMTDYAQLFVLQVPSGIVNDLRL